MVLQGNGALLEADLTSLDRYAGTAFTETTSFGLTAPILALQRDLLMYPDRLTAIASAARNAGAVEGLHNLGGVHADAHHATLTLDHYSPASLTRAMWEKILSDNERR